MIIKRIVKEVKIKKKESYRNCKWLRFKKKRRKKWKNKNKRNNAKIVGIRKYNVNKFKVILID